MFTLCNGFGLYLSMAIDGLIDSHRVVHPIRLPSMRVYNVLMLFLDSGPLCCYVMSAMLCAGADTGFRKGVSPGNCEVLKFGIFAFSRATFFPSL